MPEAFCRYVYIAGHSAALQRAGLVLVLSILARAVVKAFNFRTNSSFRPKLSRLFAINERIDHMLL